jgi:hypothetical protein
MTLSTANPSAAFLANGLNNNYGVTMTIQWGSYSGATWTASGGAHELTLTAINIGEGGSGTMSFIDPWGNGVGSDAASAGVNVNATVSTVGGKLYVTYPITWAGDGDTNPDPTYGVGGDGETGRIIGDMIMAVPEPSPALLGLLGTLLAFCGRFLRPRAKP